MYVRMFTLIFGLLLSGSAFSIVNPLADPSHTGNYRCTWADADINTEYYYEIDVANSMMLVRRADYTFAGNFIVGKIGNQTTYTFSYNHMTGILHFDEFGQPSYGEAHCERI